MPPLRPAAGLLLATLAACTDPATRTEAADKAPAAPAATPAAASTTTTAAPPAALRTATYAGEYNWGDTKREQAGGTLLVYPESDSTVLFYLDISNGPPAFHVGQLYQRAVVRRGVAYCAFQEEYDSLGCRLRLTFAPQSVVVKTEGNYGECGFGQGVWADETYSRSSSAVPQHFDDGGGRKVIFKTTSPEQYKSAGL